jgi:hypothetical protein
MAKIKICMAKIKITNAPATFYKITTLEKLENQPLSAFLSVHAGLDFLQAIVWNKFQAVI